MDLTIQDLTKDLDDIDLEDILSCWQWCLADMKGVVMITVLGDMFLVGKDNAVYWLQTDAGELTQVADGLKAFQQLLNDEEQVDNFFLPQMVKSLISAGKVLKENEVYSFKTLPVIGGEYSIENIDPTDMSIHFAFTGQICQQIKDLPDGTKVTVTLKQ